MRENNSCKKYFFGIARKLTQGIPKGRIFDFYLRNMMCFPPLQGWEIGINYGRKIPMIGNLCFPLIQRWEIGHVSAVGINNPTNKNQEKFPV